ncbi:MAG: hypothetical protein U9Q83_05460 [Bacteroidota bacterium]|nr:hypothetical protein [Bacteroidota bacterium]
MKTIKLLLLILFIIPATAFSQLDCSSFLGSLKADDPFNLNSLSKSATCLSGRTYEFVVPLSKGYEYRFIFYASSVFNNDMKFKIIDLNTNKEVLNLPGKLDNGALPKKNETALQSYYDSKLNKEVHPYFIVIPSSSTNLKIIIDIKKKAELIKGCVTVVILDKDFDSGDF